jgi:hypothetical protein
VFLSLGLSPALGDQFFGDERAWWSEVLEHPHALLDLLAEADQTHLAGVVYDENEPVPRMEAQLFPNVGWQHDPPAVPELELVLAEWLSQ